MDIGQIIRSHQQGDLAEAEAGYRAFLAATPGHLQAIQMLSLLLMQTRRSAEAADHFRLVVEAQPGNPDQWANFASLLRGAGRPDAACHAGRRALALAPDHGAGAYNLANLMVAPPPAGTGSPLKAAVWYQRILAVTPGHKQAQNGRPCWMLDQTAHLAVLDWFSRHEPDLRVRRYDFQTFPHCAFVGEK